MRSASTPSPGPPTSSWGPCPPRPRTTGWSRPGPARPWSSRRCTTRGRPRWPPPCSSGAVRWSRGSTCWPTRPCSRSAPSPVSTSTSTCCAGPASRRWRLVRRGPHGQRALEPAARPGLRPARRRRGSRRTGARPAAAPARPGVAPPARGRGAAADLRRGGGCARSGAAYGPAVRARRRAAGLVGRRGAGPGRSGRGRPGRGRAGRGRPAHPAAAQGPRPPGHRLAGGRGRGRRPGRRSGRDRRPGPLGGRPGRGAHGVLAAVVRPLGRPRLRRRPAGRDGRGRPGAAGLGRAAGRALCGLPGVRGARDAVGAGAPRPLAAPHGVPLRPVPAPRRAPRRPARRRGGPGARLGLRDARPGGVVCLTPVPGPFPGTRLPPGPLTAAPRRGRVPHAGPGTVLRHTTAPDGPRPRRRRPGRGSMDSPGRVA
ncbi:hypothetical protein NOCARDAX2BIS_210149 [Nocardioides sp. AX2bis]|nr:hypothetical protein NOCARDAX2BIS_210149 [Nocardioides sp. AX2bis]